MMHDMGAKLNSHGLWQKPHLAVALASMSCLVIEMAPGTHLLCFKEP